MSSAVSVDGCKYLSKFPIRLGSHRKIRCSGGYGVLAEMRVNYHPVLEAIYHGLHYNKYATNNIKRNIGIRDKKQCLFLGSHGILLLRHLKQLLKRMSSHRCCACLLLLCNTLGLDNKFSLDQRIEVVEFLLFFLSIRLQRTRARELADHREVFHKSWLTRSQKLDTPFNFVDTHLLITRLAA